MARYHITHSTRPSPFRQHKENRSLSNSTTTHPPPPAPPLPISPTAVSSADRPGNGVDSDGHPRAPLGRDLSPAARLGGPRPRLRRLRLLPPTAPCSADFAASTPPPSSLFSTVSGSPPPHCRHWTVQDIRDGRVLLDREPGQHGRPPVFREIVVCDPLHRRYVLLPPVPHDLAASLEYPFPPVRKPRCKPFLVPLGEEEAADGETTFRVILMAHCKTNLAALVFSSSTGQWQAAASKAWSDLALGERDMAEMSQVHPFILTRHYAYGCFYWDWVQFGGQKLLLLDTSNMEFSIADLPPGEWNNRGLAIVEAGEGRLGMFGFHGETSSDLSYTVAWNKDNLTRFWVHISYNRCKTECHFKRMRFRAVVIRSVLCVRNDLGFDSVDSLRRFEHLPCQQVGA
uniref:Uncharacterized protein n=1 Tax=Aegilops tauschii TaxID=37682 RepID=M8CIU8_AEGTA